MSLGLKLTTLIVIICIVLGLAATAVSYNTFKKEMTKYYTETGTNLAKTLASQLDPLEMDRYFETGVVDEQYNVIKSFIVDMVDNNKAEYLYVVRPHEKGVTFLFDSDLQEGEDYTDGGSCNLGTYVDLEGEFANRIPQFLAGESMEPIVQHDASFGWLMTAIVPVRHEDGSMAAYVMADISMNDVVQTRRSFLIGLAILLTVLALILLAVSLIALRRVVVHPIELLTRVTGAFIDKNRQEVNSGQMQENIPEINTGDEIEQLADAFREMQHDMRNYIHDLMKMTAEKERLGAELDVAANIQSSMLPSIFPAFPSRKEFDIYATMQPAKEVGGDFYDFFFVDDDHLALVIADVSGKGVPAALFMVIAKTMLKNSAQTGKSPKEILEQVNNQLCENNEAEMFVTVWIGILEISTGKMQCANAGHEYPAVRSGDEYCLIKDHHGFVLAGLENSKYKEYEIRLSPGDSIYVYTDGVTEATDSNQNLYGTDKMLEALNHDPSSLPKTLLPHIKADIDAFVGTAPQFDDITMLGLTYYGNKGE